MNYMLGPSGFLPTCLSYIDRSFFTNISMASANHFNFNYVSCAMIIYTILPPTYRSEILNIVFKELKVDEDGLEPSTLQRRAGYSNHWSYSPRCRYFPGIAATALSCEIWNLIHTTAFEPSERVCSFL